MHAHSMHAYNTRTNRGTKTEDAIENTGEKKRKIERTHNRKKRQKKK
jgi:hypothetical protein